MPTVAEARVIADRIAQDPVWFFETVLGARMYHKQAQMAELLRNSRRTAISGANGTGKDWFTGRAVLWWLTSHYPAKIVITGPTHRQVGEIVWRETRQAWHGAHYPLGGRMHFQPRWDVDDNHFAVGFATDEPWNIQGFHSPHLAVIITEAHGISAEVFDALQRLNPERLLMTGNPLSASGVFYDAFHAHQDSWATLQVSAFDSPNVIGGNNDWPGLVTREDIEERKRDWGEQDPRYIAGVLGQFPESLEDALVKRPWLDAAIRAKFAPDLDKAGKPLPFKPVLLALDVARFGADKSVLARRDGPNIEIIWKIQGQDTMTLVGRVMVYLADHPECQLVVVDDTGVGGGVTDRLREQRIRVAAFLAGAKARDPRRWINAQAEAWGTLADQLRQGLVKLPNDPALLAQLSSRKYRIQSDRAVALEPKDEMAKRGLHSPDEADAVAMLFSPVGIDVPRVWV